MVEEPIIPPPWDQIPTRDSLLSRIKDCHDQESWNEFYNTYKSFICSIAFKAGLSDGEAIDVLQETMLALARQMPNFGYDRALGPFRPWLMKLTRWKIANQFHKRLPLGIVEDHRCEGSSSNFLQFDELPDPQASELETHWETEWDNALAQAAMVRVKRIAAPKDYQIFDAYVIQQWPMGKVCDLFRISSTRVSLIKFRVSKIFRKQIRDLQLSYR